MADKNYNVVITVKDKATNGLKNINSQATKTGSIFSNIIKAGAITAASTAIYKLGKSAIGAADKLEQQSIAFTTMLGSAEESKKLLDDLSTFARTTPFELQGIRESAKQLLAYGIESDKILPTLTSLGNASAALGTDKFPRLVTALGQVNAKTKLSGEELRQFTETGINLIPELAKITGISEEEIASDTKKLGITFDDVNQALANMSGEGGKFFNLMAEQSKTFGGKLSNLTDAWNDFLEDAGQPLIEWGKKVLDVLIYIVEEVLPKFIKGVSGMAEKFTKFITSMQSNHKEKFELIKQITENLITWFDERFMPAFNVIKEFFIIMWEDIKTAWDTNFLGLQTLVDTWSTAIADLLTIAGTIFIGIINTLLDIISGDWESAWNTIKDTVNNVWILIESLVDTAITNIKKTINGFLNSIKDAIKKVKEFLGLRDKVSTGGGSFGTVGAGGSFANGGIVKGYAGGGIAGDTVPAMLTPGELILNAAQQKNIASRLGGVTVNINGGTYLDQNVAEEIGNMIINRLNIHTFT